MTVFRGEDAVTDFLETFDSWLSEPVRVYLLGGSAMTVRGLKDQTEDIDLALGVPAEFEYVRESLREQGFDVSDEPTEPFEGVGETVELRHRNLELEIDLFDRQIVGKVWLTAQMRGRAERFWSGATVTAFVLSDEDMFLLKAVSGGDVGLDRRRDVEDMAKYAQRGLDYDCILGEIENQRPFNTGSVEAKQIRERSHPLFAVERAVESLSGLPRQFTGRVTEFATELAVEYSILRAVDDGRRDAARIRDHVESNVRTLPENSETEVDAGIERLAEKRILERRDGTVRRT